MIFIDYTNDEPSEKMASCRYRSKKKITENVKQCCGSTKKEVAFKCIERNIFPLQNSHCELCTKYLP